MCFKEHRSSFVQITKKYCPLLVASVIIVIVVMCVYAKEQTSSRDEDEPPRSPPKNASLKNSTTQLPLSENDVRVDSRVTRAAGHFRNRFRKIKHPVPNVILMEFGTDDCTDQADCKFKSETYLQELHSEPNQRTTTAFNFLIAEDGAVYADRGWDLIGNHTKGHNDVSIGIAFIRTSLKAPPSFHQFYFAKELIEMGVFRGKLAEDYKLVFYRRHTSSDSVDSTLNEGIRNMPHFIDNFNL